MTTLTKRPISVYLEEQQYQTLRRLATDEGVSLSELIRRSVALWLTQVAVDKDRATETIDEASTDSTHPVDDASLQRFLAELTRGMEISDDNLFFGDLTVKEYFALPDEEREALWNEAYREELDRSELLYKEREALPDAIPAGQGRSAEMRRRIKEFYTRQKSDD